MDIAGGISVQSAHGIMSRIPSISPHIAMLHPSQFGPHSAWVAFQLNDQAISTQSDGDFNLIALMDAASCFILGTASIPISTGEPSQLDAKRLLKDGQSRATQWPQRLIVPTTLTAGNLLKEAENHGVRIEHVPEAELEALIGEARQSFKEYFKGQPAG